MSEWLEELELLYAPHPVPQALRVYLSAAAHTNPSLSQAGFRLRNDDGSQTTATWKAVENANATIAVDENFRVRFVVDETAGGAENNTTFQLQSNLNGAGFVNVTASSTVVRSSASPNVTDGTATTRQLTSGTGTFVANTFDEVDGLSGTTTYAGGELTEVEFCVQIRSADVADNDTIQLRVIRGTAVALEAYAQTPTVTVSEAGNSPIAGSSDVVFSNMATLAGSGALAGAAAVTFSNSATVVGDGALAGTANIVFANEGTIADAAGGAIAGTAAIAFTDTATLTGIGALAGTATATFTGQGQLAALGALSGTATLTFSESAVLTGQGALAGVSPFAFTLSGTLELPAGALQGTASMAFSNTGIVAGTGTLAGVAAAVFGDTVTLTGQGELAGSAVLTFANTGTLELPGAIFGTAAVSFVPTATIGGRGELAGIISMQFTVTTSAVGADPPVYGFGAKARIGTGLGGADGARVGSETATTRPGRIGS